MVERAIGIGGFFFRAKDPAALGRWYHDNLGIATYPPVVEGEPESWWQAAGPTVWAPFDADTDYFGRRDQQVMINLRVRDLDAMRDQLRAAGAVVLDATEVLERIGRFGWVEDPEGNRVELWEPAPESLAPPARD